ncbi:type IV pilus biogenesis protein PilM [Moraxella oculi]|uniref:Type IV pilus biogenesis protein PilM n=1 Tax=Moraxella oculi TaxID=2940516 RepID=A0ABW8U5D5_9GAMM
MRSVSRWIERVMNRLLFWRSSGVLVGIEIGLGSIQMVALTRHRGRFHVKAYATEHLNDDEMRTKQSVLSDLLRKHGITQGVVAVVPSAPVMIRNIVLPSGLGDDEVDIHIRLDAHKHIPYPLDEVNFDFAIQEDDGNQMQVLLTIVHAATVDECMDVLTACHLDINVIDVPEFALLRALSPMMVGLAGRVLLIHKDDVKTYAYVADIDDAGGLSSADYRQEYLTSGSKSTTRSHDTPHGVHQAQADKQFEQYLTDGAVQSTTDDEALVNQKQADTQHCDDFGVDFEEFLAMYAKKADGVAQHTKLSQDDEILVNVHDHAHGHDDKSDGDYEICFGQQTDGVNGLSVGFDGLGNDGVMSDAQSTCFDVALDIQKMIEECELGTQSVVDVVVLSGLMDEGLVGVLSGMTAKKVLLANPFNGMVGCTDVHLAPQMAVACGAAMRADIKGVV